MTMRMMMIAIAMNDDDSDDNIDDDDDRSNHCLLWIWGVRLSNTQSLIESMEIHNNLQIKKRFVDDKWLR